MAAAMIFTAVDTAASIIKRVVEGIAFAQALPSLDWIPLMIVIGTSISGRTVSATTGRQEDKPAELLSSFRFGETEQMEAATTLGLV